MGKNYEYSCQCSSQIKSSTSSSTFSMKKNDTCPSYSIQIYDPETGNLASYENWTVKVNMYYVSYLKTDIQDDTMTISLLGNLNLDQIKVGDIIKPTSLDQSVDEEMLITAMDVNNKTITVTRGYDSTTATSFKKKSKLIFYRIFEKDGYVDSEYEEDENDELSDDEELDYSLIKYDWNPEDTTHAGIYCLEFKISQVVDSTTKTRSFPSSSNEEYTVHIL